MQRRGSANGGAAGGRIRVAVRVRPPDYKIPKDETRPPCVAPSPHANHPSVVEFRHEAQSKNFTFDHVFGAHTTQEGVYAGAMQPLMVQFLDGYNVTVMAYGQTGSGKTYTMGNKVSVFNTTPTTSPCRERASSIPAPTIMTPDMCRYQGSDDDGLMPRFLHDLFVNLKKEPSTREIRVTFVEIYLDTLRDLLVERNSKTLAIREDMHNVWVDNLHSVQVDTLAKALEVLNAGRARQTVGMNALNDESSRSHAVYTMEVSRKFQSEVKKSKVTFVDLAGSERMKKTQVEGTRLQESIQINMGLSSLGNVISVLAEEQRAQRRSSQDASISRPPSHDPHIPYRVSKLTRLLRDGLGGNARTLIIACVSSLGSNADETMNTLQFANRARGVHNKAEKNVTADLAAVHPNPSELEITRLQDDVKRLQDQINELEAAAKRREEELVFLERARIQRKEKKRDDRRDVEMTTEITISPQVDAQTQHEGESTEEQRLSSVDALTMTDSVEEVPIPRVVDHCDASIQFGASFSESTHVASMTDSQRSTETNETGTFCDLLSSPSVAFAVQFHSEVGEAGTSCDLLTSPTIHSEIQFGTSSLHFHDIEIATDPESIVETRDDSTECLVGSLVATCQHETPATECVDIGIVTDCQPVIETTNVFTECFASQGVDAECQCDASWSPITDAPVGAEEGPVTEAAPMLAGFLPVDAASQYDLASIVDAAISTVAVVTADVFTECLEVQSADMSCQSEVAISASVNAATCTDSQPTVEAVDAATDSFTICVTDEACQSEFSDLQGVEFGMTTDPVPPTATATVSTECEIVSESVELAIATDTQIAANTVDAATNSVTFGMADEACQSEPTSTLGVEFGMSTDPCPAVAASTAGASTDSCLLVVADVKCQSESIGSQVVEFGIAADPVPAVATIAVCFTTDATESACQHDVACSVGVGVYTDGSTSAPVDVAIQSELCFFQSKDAQTTTDGNSAVETSECAYHPEIDQDQALDSWETEDIYADGFIDGDLMSGIDSDVCAKSSAFVLESAEGPTFKPNHGDTAMLESQLITSLACSPETIGSMHEVDQVRSFELNSTKISNSVIQESEEKHPTKSTSSVFGSRLEVDANDHGMFVCCPIDDEGDEFFDDSSSTTRGVVTDENFGFEPLNTVSDGEQHGELTDTNPPSCVLPLPISLLVKPSATETDLISKEIVDELQHLASPMAPPAPDFVVVRSPRLGNRGRSDRTAPLQVSLRGTIPKRSQSPSHQSVHPLRMFTFDDSSAVAPTPEKTALQAKHLYENLRQLTRDEFGDDSDENEHTAVVVPRGHSTVGQLMTGTKDFIQRRQQRQQRIAHLRGHIRTLEDLLQVENRAPISEPELNAYSGRVQEEFLLKLHQQLATLAAERLRIRLKNRLAAVQFMALAHGDEDASSPFLRLDQCHACAEWFFHHTEDTAFFEKQLLPFLTSGWISLTPHELDAEHAWFQL